MKKNILKFISVVSLLTSCLTGCGSTKSQNTGTEAAKGEKVKIEYWHCNAETQGGQTVEELVKKFNEQSDSVEVVAKYNPDMYKGLMQNLQAEAATGKSPAVVQIGWAFLDYFSNNFAYTEPQKIIDKYYEADKTFLQDNFLPNVLGLAKNSSGSQVGIPYSLSTSLLESNGARMITDGKASFASEEGIKAYEVYADMVVNTKSALHISWGEGVQSFIDGNVAMLYTTIAQRANVQKGATFDAAAINSPSWSGKEKRLPAGGCFLAITAQSEEEQKAAWEFEKYLYSVESMAEWTKGTGYVPPRKDVAEAENGLKSFLEENKMMEAATTQMDGVVSWTSFPGDAGLEAEQILLDTRDKILSGSVSARDGLTKAQEDINVLLSK